MGTVVKVIDGDTIQVQLDSGPITVRLDSIDAPEMNQAWGPDAKAALARRIDRKQVALEVTTQDQYDRVVAVVYLGDENINGWMTKHGHAWAYRQFLNNDAYCAWEDEARSSDLGLWGLPSPGPYAPWEWRHLQGGATGRLTDYSQETAARCEAGMRQGVPAPREIKALGLSIPNLFPWPAAGIKATTCKVDSPPVPP